MFENLTSIYPYESTTIKQIRGSYHTQTHTPVDTRRMVCVSIPSVCMCPLEPVWAMWAARWIRRLGAGEVEDFWVWAAARAAPMAASLAVAVAAAVTCGAWWLAAVAVYTNVMVPWCVLVAEVKGRRSPKAALALVCRGPTQQV